MKRDFLKIRKRLIVGCLAAAIAVAQPVSSVFANPHYDRRDTVAEEEFIYSARTSGTESSRKKVNSKAWKKINGVCYNGSGQKLEGAVTRGIDVSEWQDTINWSQEHVPAIVHITHCSQEQGNGLADVLFGKVNPAGRTVQTWVKDIIDLPDMMDYDIRNGRTYMYHQGPVLYPFGYGLSYSDFTYEKIESVKQDKKNIRVTVSVKNTSGRDGEEVVQLYASYPDSKVERPSKQLRAFKRIPIKAGETREVTLTVPKEELGYWNEGKQMFVVEPGTVKLLIGASSEDIRLEGKVKL